MKVVVDSNIVYSAILNTNSKLAKILLHPSEHVQFCTVEYLKEEIEGHKVRIMEVTGFSDAEFQQNRDMLYEHISFLQKP